MPNDISQRISQLVEICEPFVKWLFNPNELPTNEDHIHLWENKDGELIGFACMHNPAVKDSQIFSFTFVVHPQVHGKLESAIISWVKATVRDLNLETPSLACRASSSDLQRITVLKEQGFVQREEKESLFMAVPSTQEISQPQVPIGYEVRPFSKRGDIDGWLKLWEKTQDSILTKDERLAWLTYPSYAPNLDLIAVAPDGTIASYCVGNIFSETNGPLGDDAAWILWLGTDSNYRRKGLASTLMKKILMGLHEYGCERALLNVLSTNTPAIKLYQSHGFKTVYQMFYYITEIKM